ncbi:hypothetical protein CA11_26880 [Gimesia maris]|uniref:hypothetical protein n=1 Tax=Gimesia maris TaxID=122 RepID=UPI0011890146|nr:hypothetical protein [Gimesia maris]QDU14876.1 hypothetical protein CA11_26880 [Gimesia maris]
MNDPSKDWELRDASMTLGDLVRLSWTAGKLNSMEAELDKMQEQLAIMDTEQLGLAESEQTEFTEDCDFGKRLELLDATKDLMEAIEDAKRFRPIIEENTRWITQTIENSLHVFANLSEKVVYGHERPTKLIATSGHHAGIMLLRRYLVTDYTSEYGFDFEELAIQIQSERLRLFQVDDSFDETGTSKRTHQAIVEEIENISERSPLFHDAAEELPEEYKFESGGKPKPLEGNRTELVYSVTGITGKPGNFKDMIKNRCLWAIKLSDRKYELYFPKQYHAQIEDYRLRLAEYRNRDTK